MKSAHRPYVMKTRAAAAAATRDAILEATRAMLLTHAFDDITIDAVAERAATTGRTVLRLFAGKEGLLEAALRTLGAAGRAPAAPGDVAEAFALQLGLRAADARGRLHDGLIVACDVYTWKLLRRDFGLDTAAALAVVRTLVDALVREGENG